MHLKTISLKNYRCFTSLDVNLEPGLTVFVAENGQGKTAVLDAIACLLGRFVQHFVPLGLLGLKDEDFHDEWKEDESGNLLKNKREPLLSLSAIVDVTGYPCWNRLVEAIPWEVTRIRDKSDETRKSTIPYAIASSQLKDFATAFIEADNADTPSPYPILAYYGTNRVGFRQPVNFGRLREVAYARKECYRTALNGKLNYGLLVDWLLHVEFQQLRDAKMRGDLYYRSIESLTIEKAIMSIMPGFSNLKAYDRPTHLEIDFREGDSARRLLVDQQLSDGHKTTLTLVLDIVSRILEANGKLPGVTPESLLASKGIILIDEVDLHLHPSWQQHIIPDLIKTFPNIQFIVTTHSPQVVSSVPAKSLRVVSHGRVEQASCPTQGVEVATILRGIFGTFPSPQDIAIVKKLNKFTALTSQGEWQSSEWRNLYEELAMYYGRDYGPLKGVIAHKDFLERISAGASNA